MTFFTSTCSKMSGVDLKTHKDALLKAHKDVSDPNGSIDWALFGYEGKTNVLKLVETGDGGIEELVEELNTGRIQYAYLRMNDPNTGLSKFVLVNWQGEGVQEMRKGSCASHFRDVSAFFRGAHLTIHARSEDDLDEDAIKDKVSKSSGANYSIHKEKAQIIPEAGPVSSVYKKTVPVIKTDARDKFWEQQQKLEKDRQESEAQRLAEQRKTLEAERKEREEEESKLREQREQERLKKIREIKAAEKQANAADTEALKQKWESVQRDAVRDDEERRKRSEMARKERAAEAKSLVQQRGANPRSVFENKPKSMFDDESPASPTSPTSPKSPGFKPPTRKLQHTFLKDDQDSEEKPRKQPIQLPTAEPESERPSLANQPSSPPAFKPARQPEPEPEPEAETEPEYEEEPPRELAPAPPAQPAPVPARQAAPALPAQPPRQPAPVPASPVSPTPPVSQGTTELPQTRNLMAQGLPKRQDSDDEEEEDQDWDDDTTSHTPQAVIATPAAQPVADPEPEENYYEEPPADNHVTDEREQSPYKDEGTIFLDKGQCARALYDYQAEDDTEITFDPDDLITNIEQIDEGWWTGTAPSGQHGMFPANYVELM